jgi:hypothetical protein
MYFYWINYLNLNILMNFYLGPNYIYSMIKFLNINHSFL